MGGGGVVVVVVVDTDALPSSRPSLIWLSWGFGLAWAVTKTSLKKVAGLNMKTK